MYEHVGRRQISIEQFMYSSHEHCAPGAVFRMTEDNLLGKLEELCICYPETYRIDQTAGLHQLYQLSEFQPREALEQYYTEMLRRNRRMKLADKISINTQYTRSTNIERDRDSQAIVKAYLPTSRGVTVLNEVAVALGRQDQPRAWSLIGPYGSGKSSFALFLNHLLGESSSPIGKTALRVMENDHEALAKQFKQQNQWCRVMLTGSAEPLSARLLAALNICWDRVLGQ